MAGGVTGKMPEIRRFERGWAVFLCALGLLLGLSAPGHAVKASPPVAVSWEVSPLPDRAGAYRVKLTLAAVAPMENVTVTLALPGEMTLIQGEPRVSRPMAAGEEYTLTVDLSAPAGAAMLARIEGGTASNVLMLRTVTIHVDPDNIRTKSAPDLLERPLPVDGVREVPSR